MRRIAVFAGLALFVGAAGCNSFLDATKAVSDPNQPTTATRNNLLVGVEAQVMDQQEGGVAMLVCEWMQQCAGTAGRFVEEYNKYNITGSSFNGNFNSLYTGGGLIALRTIDSSATADGDLVYRGVAEVLEAMQVMWAADAWGDIVYSNFVVGKTDAAYDGQMAVYASLLTLLDKAITDLAGAGVGPKPSSFDLFYNGDKVKYTALAHTLKARIYLHRAEKLPGQYPLALAEANNGINAANGTQNLHGIHTANTSERNLWAQFQVSSFGNDLVAGARLVNLMKADNDPRLPEYFGLNALGTYGGQDPQSTVDPKTISPLVGSTRTNDVTFPIPYVTWEENQLIKAEANFVINGGGAAGALAAQPFLDAVRAAHGKGSTPATLQSIMEEKYIDLFQNVETWSDFKRTCYPRLVPVQASYTAVPGRLFYGSTEKQTNPNIPAEGPLQTTRNANDPNPCPTS